MTSQHRAAIAHINLDAIKRLAQDASAEAEGDWFCADLLENHTPISSSFKARRHINASSPDVVLALVAAVQAAQAWTHLLSLPLRVPTAHDELRRIDQATYGTEKRAALAALRQALQPFSEGGNV